MEILDLIILGAGPCGIATTKALTKVCPNLKFKVIEARPKGQVAIGAQNGIGINGQKAMRAIDEQLFQDLVNYPSVELVKSFVMDENDTINPDSPYAFDRTNVKIGLYGIPDKGSEYKPKFIGWSELTKVIQDTIDPRFEDNIMYSTKCAKVEVLPPNGEQQLVQVTLQDGTKLKSRFLIGCDGYFSRARQALYGKEKDPIFLDTIFWRGRFKTQDFIELQKKGDVKFDIDLTTQAIFHFGDQILALTSPITQDVSIFSLSARTPFFERIGLDVNQTRTVQRMQEANDNPEKRSISVQESLKDSDPLEIYNRIKFALEHFSPLLQKVFTIVNPEQLTEHGIFTAEYDKFDETYWGKDNVLLLGDACHSTRPTGQGVNQAFEDAATLGHLVKEKGLSSDTFRELAKLRTQRIKTHLEIAVKQGTGSYDKNKMSGKDQDLISTIDGPNSREKISLFYADVNFEKL